MDGAALEAAMKDLQKLLHPDKFSTRPERERAYSADQASLVNRAYATLQDPLARAKHMLDCRGHGLQEDEGRGDTQMDPALLMEVMEAREAVEEARGEGQLRELLEENDAKLRECLKDVAAAFGDAGDLPAAKRAVVRLTYVVKIKEGIVERL